MSSSAFCFSLPSENHPNTKNLPPLLRKRQPEIHSQSFIDSLEILARYEFVPASESPDFVEQQCFFCKTNFSAKKEAKTKCADCFETFCARHRRQINHNCQKLDANISKYLMAKNLFRERMRAIKAKGH